MNTAVTRIEAPSRLHFGLLAMPGECKWPNSEGQQTVPARHFGGAGLMIDKPGIALSVAPASAWAAQGPNSARALEAAKLICNRLGIKKTFRVLVERCSAEHLGLGTGTQLSLAVARAIAIVSNQGHLAAVDLAKLVGRGRRSALGIHGFAHGGFVVEGGKREPEVISPLVARAPFPAEWAIVLAIPRDLKGDHGQRETEVFEAIARRESSLPETDSMCRLLLLGILPALIERDLPVFGEALYDLNRRAGEMYRHVQGGVYSCAQVAEVVSFLRANGVQGVGQSSWGPAVFGVTDSEKADWMRGELNRRFGESAIEVVVTRAWNHGAKCPA